jgi:CubicO group peptidase (beta-lactamase class C family)
MFNKFIVFLILALMFYSQTSVSNQIQVPQSLSDGWEVSSLDKEGFNIRKFIEIENLINNDKYKDLQSISVFRNNKIVYDKHINGSTYSTITDIRSATKSFISALIGIAIDKGSIKSVVEKILPYFSDYYPIKNLDENKRNIKIRDLLTMTAGFDSEDEVRNSKGNEDNLDALSSDWVRFSIDIPMLNAPGEKWAYSSMNTFLLGYILEKATGEKLEEFAKNNLFAPLGINNIQWRKTPQKRVVAQGNFKISSRDMGKFGQLILDNGVYKGKQIISMKWISQSTKGIFPVHWNNYDTYGYQWYNHTLNINGELISYVLASGNGGNKIYIIPKYDIVVTVISTAYGKGRGHIRSLDILKKVLESS